MNSNSIIIIQITHRACLLRIQLSYRRERERETCLPHRNRNSHLSRSDMSVEVSIVLTLVILAGIQITHRVCLLRIPVLYWRERLGKRCLPHRNRNSHCPRRGGDMPVEVSVVLTLVINKPLTGCGCLGLGCCIGERETCLPHRNRTHIVHVHAVTCL